MVDPKLRKIRIANFILALAVILGCTNVLAHNLSNWHVILSGFATMTFWSTLCYATWHGLGPQSTQHLIKRAQIVNIAISILFTLMISTIVFSASQTPFPILLPMAMLTLPLIINVRALGKMKEQLNIRNFEPSL